ncbi:hypothetical protein DACRYDRAFT_22829 [Dacryopinax primogenitus]|uniref:Protein-S-isoprenylcysteine O-methyltransferase n=1 Tax=Dacryopinax primogenitus (strain DJM 731) TaxID=1858805 RepID=M5FX49_DACPD|nr:uncharacterized protein DACRYDRAFT_22829 [Dacryopinax primogenitus]EJU01004.1 hypothetical protein DACRYDRAFT_22829 [Dacryopinax primogenitus]
MRHKDTSFVKFALFFMSTAFQFYIVIYVISLSTRVGLAFVYPDIESRICTCQPSMGMILAGIFGCLLGWIGTELRAWCYKALGQYFTFHLAVQENQTLVTTGPYTYLRHPSYLGGCLEFLAVSPTLILCNPISMCWGRHLLSRGPQIEAAFMLFFLVAPWIAYPQRIAVEEKMMKAKFGKEYAEWEKKTWRVIPLVY